MNKLIAVCEHYAGVIALSFILCVSAGMNVYFLEKLQRSVAAIPFGVQESADLSVVMLQDVDGSKVNMRLNDGRESILYVFSPACIYCQKNLMNIKALADNTGKSYRFIGLSNTKQNLASYVSDTKLPFPVYVKRDNVEQKALDLSETPQTILVGADGHVKKVWRGAFDSETQGQVEKYFAVRLPGLS